VGLHDPPHQGEADSVSASISVELLEQAEHPFQVRRLDNTPSSRT